MVLSVRHVGISQQTKTAVFYNKKHVLLPSPFIPPPPLPSLAPFLVSLSIALHCLAYSGRWSKALDEAGFEGFDGRLDASDDTNFILRRLVVLRYSAFECEIHLQGALASEFVL